eukprot:366564-Chlamydomonas_euryale.AAC.21
MYGALAPIVMIQAQKGPSCKGLLQQTSATRMQAAKAPLFFKKEKRGKFLPLFEEGDCSAYAQAADHDRAAPRCRHVDGGGDEDSRTHARSASTEAPASDVRTGCSGTRAFFLEELSAALLLLPALPNSSSCCTLHTLSWGSAYVLPRSSPNVSSTKLPKRSLVGAWTVGLLHLGDQQFTRPATPTIEEEGGRERRLHMNKGQKSDGRACQATGGHPWAPARYCQLVPALSCIRQSGALRAIRELLKTALTAAWAFSAPDAPRQLPARSQGAPSSPCSAFDSYSVAHGRFPAHGHADGPRPGWQPAVGAEAVPRAAARRRAGGEAREVAASCRRLRRPHLRRRGVCAGAAPPLRGLARGPPIGGHTPAGTGPPLRPTCAAQRDAEQQLRRPALRSRRQLLAVAAVCAPRAERCVGATPMCRAGRTKSMPACAPRAAS